MLKTEKSAKIDNLGRIVIPKGIRNALDLAPDTYVDIVLDGERIIVRRTENAAPSQTHLHNELDLILEKYCHIPLIPSKIKCAKAVIDELFKAVEGE